MVLSYFLLFCSLVYLLYILYISYIYLYAYRSWLALCICILYVFMHICLGHLYIYVSCISLYICVVHLHKYILCMSINIYVVCLDTYISCISYISLYIYILYIFINIHLVYLYEYMNIDLFYMCKYCIFFLQICLRVSRPSSKRLSSGCKVADSRLSFVCFVFFFSSGTSYHWVILWNRPCENCDNVFFYVMFILRFWCIDVM